MVFEEDIKGLLCAEKTFEIFDTARISDLMRKNGRLHDERERLEAEVRASQRNGGGGGGGFGSFTQRTATLHPGDKVHIDGEEVGFCKHAWKIDPATGVLRTAVVFGHPDDHSGGSPWGQGIVYDYERTAGDGIRAIRTDYGCIITKVYVHPDEGEGASDEVHRAAWIEITWAE